MWTKRGRVSPCFGTQTKDLFCWYRGRWLELRRKRRGRNWVDSTSGLEMGLLDLSGIKHGVRDEGTGGHSEDSFSFWFKHLVLVDVGKPGGEDSEWSGGTEFRCPRGRLEAASGAGAKTVNYMHLGLSGGQTADRLGVVTTGRGRQRRRGLGSLEHPLLRWHPGGAASREVGGGVATEGGGKWVVASGRLMETVSRRGGLGHWC